MFSFFTSRDLSESQEVKNAKAWAAFLKRIQKNLIDVLADGEWHAEPDIFSLIGTLENYQDASHLIEWEKEIYKGYVIGRTGRFRLLPAVNGNKWIEVRDMTIPNVSGKSHE